MPQSFPTRRRWFLFGSGTILLAMAIILVCLAWALGILPEGRAFVDRQGKRNQVAADIDKNDRPTNSGELAADHDSHALRPTFPYPIRQQPGIWPPELPDIPRPLPPPGATSVTGYIFAENDLHNPQPATVQVDYLRMYASVNGQTVLVNNDDYGKAAGQRPVAWGNWTPRADLTDPTIEIPGTVADAWAPTYFTTIPSKHPDYATQIWNARPGRVPAGATKVWVAARLLVSGSGLAHIGFDWYGPQGYIANGGYSGFQIFASPDWQVVTFGK